MIVHTPAPLPPYDDSKPLRLLMTPPIKLRVTVSDADNDGVFVASEDRTTVYGAGPTADAAVADYWHNVELDRSFLIENEATLGPALLEELASLRTLTPPITRRTTPRKGGVSAPKRPPKREV